MFKLVIQDDEGKTTVVPLIRDEITIGRKEGNTIRLTERNVSRRHARILRNNGEVQIEDLGSYNGIRVNNARIAERVNLRVSDQVQIGDYKLYLKAEGVEQVDDARTMPIERVDSSNTPTEAIPAVPAPTQPVTIPQIPAVAAAISPTPPPGQLAGIQIVGAPNRTMVAVADTDPDGRPRARPEHIAAAIPQVAGYGKLVVLSSNFAGKEFELSRPQMIIGRTDENDLVVNHRSISRNHAKVVREPDTQRYTISDLQSSNGVRVNGQDYGKVELRRGDVIDLGHVRLRFVEPGEDFLFSRDAVITDVPESGSKKGLMIAIILGLVVLGGVVVFFLMRGTKEDDKPPGPGTGTNSVVEIDGGSTNVVTNTIDAAEVVQNTVDAPAGPSNPDIANIVGRCKEAVNKKDWFNVDDCGNELKKVGSAADAQVYIERAKLEIAAEKNLRDLRSALKESSPNVKEATRLLDAIPTTSVYAKEAKVDYDKGIKDLMSSTVADLNALARQKQCDQYAQKLKTIESAFGGSFASDARSRARKCEDKAIVPPPPKPCEKCGEGYKCENDKCVKIAVTAPTSICADIAGVADIEQRGDASLNQGSFAAALGSFEQILKCKPGLASKAYLAACRAHNFAKAKIYFKGLPATMAQICLKESFDPRLP